MNLHLPSPRYAKDKISLIFGNYGDRVVLRWKFIRDDKYCPASNRSLICSFEMTRLGLFKTEGNLGFGIKMLLIFETYIQN